MILNILSLHLVLDEMNSQFIIPRLQISILTQLVYFNNRGKKFGTDGQLIDYGYCAKKNDTIGVLLEYKAGFGTLSFYRNGVRKKL